MLEINNKWTFNMLLKYDYEKYKIIYYDIFNVIYASNILSETTRIQIYKYSLRARIKPTTTEIKSPTQTECTTRSELTVYARFNITELIFRYNSHLGI